MSSHFYQLSAAASIKQQPSYRLLTFVLNHRSMAVGLNDEAYCIIQLCDGTRTSNQIISTVANTFNTSFEDATNKVRPFLNDLVNIGLVFLLDEPHKIDVRVLGSTEFYTPEQVVIELTHRCPLNCVHCYLNAGVGPDLPNSNLMSIIDELTNHIGVRGIQFTGGEPFINPSIHEAIQKLVDSYIPIQITTSGYLINEKIEKSLALLANPSCSVQVSLDGLEDSYNLIRRKNDAFCRAIQFIEYCINHDIRVSTATVLINQSDTEVFQLCALAKSLGVSLFRMGLLSNQGRAVGLHAPAYSVERFGSLMEKLKAAFEDENFKVGYIDENLYSGENCGAGYKLIAIGPDLSVRPCLLIPYCIGTLDGTSIYKFSEANSWKYVHLNAPSQSWCSGCGLSNRCKGCIAEGIANRVKVKNCEWSNLNKQTLSELGVFDSA